MTLTNQSFSESVPKIFNYPTESGIEDVMDPIQTIFNIDILI